jgi:hypothetical protein
LQDITKEVNIYRECIRNLWNVYFLSRLTEENEFDLKDEFEEISTMIFSSLILNRIGCESFKKSKLNQSKLEPLNFITVSPSDDSGIPLNINRDRGSSKREYWDHPVDFIKPDDVDMKFIDFYDFDQYGFRDFEFYLVNIKESSIDTNLKERNALVKTKHARIFFDSSKI